MRYNLCLIQKILTLKVTRYCLKEKKIKEKIFILKSNVCNKSKLFFSLYFLFHFISFYLQKKTKLIKIIIYEISMIIIIIITRIIIRT
jgi:hypothetical protein